MDSKHLEILIHDNDGLECYEYLANNIHNISDEDLMIVVNYMRNADPSGQFLASAARYLHAFDPVRFQDAIKNLVAGTIDKDREHKYLPQLMTSLYGEDCISRHESLCVSDDNFRRIYKRLYPDTNKL